MMFLVQAPTAPNLSGVASALGVTVEKLERALGEPPPDLAAVAAELGVTEQELTEALARSGLGPPPWGVVPKLRAIRTAESTIPGRQP